MLSLQNYLTNFPIINIDDIINLKKFEELQNNKINSKSNIIISKNINSSVINRYEYLYVKSLCLSDIISCDNDYLKSLEIIKNNPDKKYKMIITNPDIDFPYPKHELEQFNDNAIYNDNKQHLLNILNYREKLNISILENLPSNLEQIYCLSNGYHHNLISMIPIGIDWKGINFNKNIKNLDLPIKDIYNDFEIKNKTILCYYNLTLPTNYTYAWYGKIRQLVYDNIKNKDFIIKENCQHHPRIYNLQNNINFYFKLSKSKFMICPRGCGIDTYRMWDCIYFGCIPIVEKYDGYKQFEDLPILFIDYYTDYYNLTESFLEDKWKEMISKEYNYEKIKLSYWENQIYNT